MEISEEYIPISMLNQLLYCPRRFYYIHVLGEMNVNALVLEGMIQHEVVHGAGTEGEGRYRRVYVWSEHLKVAGFTDLLEERGGTLLPVEYKHGRVGRWINDHVQLCAQAMCVEEQTGQSVSRGEIFYWGTRRRQAVEFTSELRLRTKNTVVQARTLAEMGVLPAPLNHPAKCRDCSLEPICLPQEVRRLRGEAVSNGQEERG